MKTSLAAALALAATCSAASAVDFSAALISETGQAYQECARPDATAPGGCAPSGFVPLTLGHMIAAALNVPADQAAKPEEIVGRGLLAMKIRDAREIELTDVERDTIKKYLFSAGTSLGYRPVAIVQALRAVDPAAVPKDK